MGGFGMLADPPVQRARNAFDIIEPAGADPVPILPGDAVVRVSGSIAVPSDANEPFDFYAVEHAPFPGLLR